MKFLENAQLEALNLALNSETENCSIETRVESYSCKMVQSDKRVFRDLLKGDPAGSANSRQALSPPVVDDPWAFPNANSHSPQASGSDMDQEEGNSILCDTISRKRLFSLVTLLNLSFPDYDFTDAKGENFFKVPCLDMAVRSVDMQLGTVIPDFQKVRSQMWCIIDEEIGLTDCFIYSYNPDYSSDPFSEDGCMWSFNYFFFNKKLRRILFFACRAISQQGSSSGGGDDVLWNLDE